MSGESKEISLVRSAQTGGLVADLDGEMTQRDWEDRLVVQLNLRSPLMAKSLLREMSKAFGLSRKSPVNEINAALHALMMLEPKDLLELQLMVQMLCVSRQSLEIMGLAATSTITETRELYLNLTARLMRLYTKQLESLGKYRQKPQIIRIEKVSMEGNSQAVFGSTGSGGQ